MTVLMQHRNPGMTKEQYDKILASVGELLTTANGFRAHYGVVDEKGVITAVEVWDCAEDHDRWYDIHIRPHIAPDAPPPEFAEILGTLTR
jgi:hypothetical protein